MGLFFYTKIGSIISIGDLPTTNIIEPEEKLSSRKDKFRPFFFDIQSDKNHFFEVFKVSKSRGIALDKTEVIELRNFRRFLKVIFLHKVFESHISSFGFCNQDKMGPHNPV